MVSIEGGAGHGLSQDGAQPEDFWRPIGEVVDRAQVTDEGQGGPDDARFDGVDTIESLCMECGQNGTTRMLLTSIPFFRQVVIVSFKCPHCHHSNNSIQPAAEIQVRGSTYTVSNLSTPQDLNRQVVKSEHCRIFFKEIELEIPKGASRLTTLEGLIRGCLDDLSMNQPVRRHTDPELFGKIEVLLEKLNSILECRFGPLTIELEDISGNSFIEALGGLSDPHWSKREFNRTAEQNLELGLIPNQHNADPPPKPTDVTEDFDGENPDEVYSFPTVCSSCGNHLETRIKTLDIPHFKDVVLMSTNCHSCGYKDNEVKAGGAVSAVGTKHVLRVTDKEDLSRDVLKSETASMSVPELDLHLHSGTLGGRFTTVEGLLTQVYEELDQKVLARGDSVPDVPPDNAESSESLRSNSAMEVFLKRLRQAISAEFPYTVIIDDPMSNSYIQNIYAPDPDPYLTKTEYTRTFEQNEELGLNDMKTENY